ncbi:Amino-acid acetyltransferase, mitochondrial [Kalmusia sp. IMI 367209]|nr:Amino-acid acetyltransferase, mitochondrial [Kalmusia sp. IMI 367209]
MKHVPLLQSPDEGLGYTFGIEPGRNGRKSVAKERQRAERDQLTRLLKESPGKRDARNFLKHFDQTTPNLKPAKSDTQRLATEAVERAHHNEWRLTRTGVNLGNLYEPTKAAQNNPVFTREELPDKPPQDKDLEPLHLALVKLRQPQALDDETLGGIGLTLSQMAKLGLNIAVVVDCDGDDVSSSSKPNSQWETIVREQASRIVDALEEFNEPGAFEVDHALYFRDRSEENSNSPSDYGDVEVKNNHLLFPPIEDGIIPVIPPFAYNTELKKVRVTADDVVLALTREFSGLTSRNLGGNEQQDPEDALRTSGANSSRNPVMDRIIVLDPLGGIPAEHRADGAHVFINLEAEYRDIRAELERPSSTVQSTNKPQISPLGNSNPFSKFIETEIAQLPGSETKQIAKDSPPSRHVKNLDVVRRALRLLPPSSSAIIITPAEAAISSQAAQRSTSASVRTRRTKNPLIHNLLTDKPMTSSSLPDPLVTRPLASAAPNPATFLKKGIPVTILPDPRVTGPWRPPSPSNPSIELENDPRINFSRLVDLIEDSFRRKLDARDYLNRVRGRVAGVIIAGDYEGGAICTWETPSSQSATPPPDSPLWVPYLDKFAVLTKSQGSGGVADIVWGALTRTAFPDGVCWRSRTTNPVNKWYFERAVGMWNLPDGYWTMFWTTEGVVEECAKKKSSVRAGCG